MSWYREQVEGLISIGLSAYALILAYRGWKVFKDEYIHNIKSYPLKCNDNQLLFKCYHMRPACQTSAKAVFQLLTGYDLTVVEYLQSSLDSGNLDSASSLGNNNELVHYYTYIWSEPHLFTRSTDLCHHLVYYRGYLYQSYSTYRYGWTEAFTDGYPVIRSPITDKEILEIFAKTPEKLTVGQFNEWCAPECHPIPAKASLRFTVHYSAKVNPARDLTSITIKNLA